MNVSAASTISGGEPPPIYHRSQVLLANQPHLQQQQLIQQHLQQKYQRQHTANESNNTKDDGSSARDKLQYEHFYIYEVLKTLIQVHRKGGIATTVRLYKGDGNSETYHERRYWCPLWY